mgnify:CR=1 FL=1
MADHRSSDLGGTAVWGAHGHRGVAQRDPRGIVVQSLARYQQKFQRMGTKS